MREDGGVDAAWFESMEVGLAAPPAAHAHPPADDLERAGPSPRATWAQVLVIAGVGAIVASFAPGRPAGLALWDVVLRAAFVGGLSIACSQARRWTWLVLAAGAAASGQGVAVLVAAWSAFALSLVAAVFDIRRRRLGALVGALAGNALLWTKPWAFFGSSTLLGIAIVVPVFVSAYNLQTRARRRTVRRVCWTVGGLTLLAVAAVAIAGLLGAGHVSRGTEAARSGVSAAKAGDQDRSAASFSTASEEFGAADDLFNSWFITPSRLIPLVSDQTDALGRMASIGRDLADAAGTVTSEADYRRITASDGRIDVDQIRSWSDPLDDIDHALRSADEVSDSIDVEWLLPQIRDRYADLDGEVTGAIEEISTAKALVAVAPDLLGGSGTRRYFIAFTTPAESRGLGGFMGNWAILEATDGRLELTRSGRSDELRPSAGDPPRALDAPADYVARYGPLLPEQEVRDITFSPDFPSVGQALASVYPQTVGGAPIDGALALDPYAVAAMLDITGPIRVEGLAEPLTSDNAADYLLREQYLTFDPADVNGERIDILEEASRTTFEEFVGAGSFRPSQLASVLGPMVAERRLVAYSATPAEEDVIRAVGLDGAFPSAGTDDFMALVTQNAGNNKIDIFLHRTIEYAATVDPSTGELRATATITLRNDAPDHGLPRYVIGNRTSSGQPDGANWLWFNFYTPHVFESATLDGQTLAINASSEFGLNVINTFLPVPPGGTAVVEISVRGSVSPSDQFHLQWFQQPTVNTDKVIVSAQRAESGGDGSSSRRPDADGVTREERTDQQVEIDLGP